MLLRKRINTLQTLEIRTKKKQQPKTPGINDKQFAHLEIGHARLK